MLLPKNHIPSTLASPVFRYLKIVAVGASSAVPAIGLIGMLQFIAVNRIPEHGLSGWGVIIALLSLLILSLVIPVWFISALRYDALLKKLAFATGWLVFIGLVFILSKFGL